MFESILIRKADAFQMPVDAGLIAEALLFYNQVIIAANRGDLIALLKTVGPDDLIGLIEDGHIAITFYEDTLGTYTSTTSGVEEHRFVAMELVGDQKKRKMSKEEKLIKLVEQALGASRHSKRIARKLLAHMPHRKLNRTADAPLGVVGVAFSDLDDKTYVREAVQEILKIYVPSYARSHHLHFDIVKAGESFFVGHNINFEAANAEFHKHTPKEYASLTTAFIITHLLDARGEMFLSAEYLSELVTTPVLNSLIELRFRHLLMKHQHNLEEIRMFYNIALEGRSLREVVNSGERSFSEFRRLLEKADRFKSWLKSINPDQQVIAEYHKAATAETWIDSLPVKGIRFAICTAAGLAGPFTGLGAGAVDTFLIEKIFRGWRPHHFVQGPLFKFLNPERP